MVDMKSPKRRGPMHGDDALFKHEAHEEHEVHAYAKDRRQPASIGVIGATRRRFAPLS